jgi:myo-inositol-1(or 4)-monophosphatase
MTRRRFSQSIPKSFAFCMECRIYLRFSESNRLNAVVNQTQQKHALQCAVRAAHAAGRLMRENFRSTKKIDSQTQHDIKLELDRRCQEVIERTLRRDYPSFAVLGEEGVSGNPQAEFRWVIDPIDGTVNFTYGIPHCCVSIALQQRTQTGSAPESEYDTTLGAVYDPFCDELWTATQGRKALLNGRPIAVSSRRKLSEAIVAIGFAKEGATIKTMLPKLNALLPRVRKMRMMGSAALSMVYVASGRHDAYIEHGIRLWDLAAGGLILECAGGEFWRRHLGDNVFQVLANNGKIRPLIERGMQS